jgi:TP901 family phage tail tape measure protein
MASTRQVRAGAAYVELTTRDNKLVRGLQRAAKRLKTFAASAKAAGMKMLTSGGLASVPFALSAKAFASFEQQMARVQALTGATGEEFSRLESMAKKLGATTTFSASQAAEAMSYFALAGFETQQIMDALGPTLNLAAAGQIEIAEAADIAAKIMSGMGLEATELGSAIDVMAKAMTTANTDLTMLGDAFKFVGPMAKTAGVSLEEITGAIQLLSNAGIQGEMAGTTLRGMLLSLTSPSAEAQKELDRLGVRVIDSAGNVRSLTGIIGDLERALSGVGSGEKLRVLGSIFPARQAAGAAELVSQGAERLAEATAALGDASGTAAGIAGTQLDTLQGDFTILLSALEGVGIAIGEALGDSLRAGIQGVTDLLALLGEWIGKNREVVITAAAIVAGVTLLGGALVALGIGAQITAFGFAGLASAIGLAASLIGAILSPMGLLVAAAVALGTYLLYASDAGSQALAWLADRFAVLKDDALKSWNAIGAALASGNIALAGKILWLTLKMEWQRGVNYLTRLWLDFKKTFLDIASEATFGAAGAFTDATAGLEVAWVETVGFLADAWSVFVNMLTQTWNTTVGFIRKAWVRLKSLFDEDIDVDTEVAAIDDETNAKNAASEQNMLESVGERDRNRRQRRAEIEADREGTQDALAAMQAAEQQQREAQFDRDLAASQAEVEEARREWQQSIAAAQSPEEQAEAAGTESGKPKVSLPEVEASLQGSRSVLDDQQRKVESKGGFNALGLAGLGADSLSQRTAKATEQVAVNTKTLVDQAKRGRLIFTE